MRVIQTAHSQKMLLGPIFILLCFAVIKGLFPLPCGDCFHTNCIDAWLKTKSECPICRKAVLPNELETNPHIPNNVQEPVRRQNTGGTTTGGSRPSNADGKRAQQASGTDQMSKNKLMEFI
uniref:RING-type domain-containing protein n=1 Tax=Globodera rostochiensis TaxID=31243 RepID=A0A914I0W1_GLORO